MKRKKLLFLIFPLTALLLLVFVRDSYTAALAAVVLLLPAVSYLYGKICIKCCSAGLDFNRTEAVKNQTVELSIKVKNRSILPAIGVTVKYIPPGKRSRTPATVVRTLPPKGRSIFKYEQLCDCRGIYRWGVETISVYGLFGLFYFEKKVGIMSDLVVWPLKINLPPRTLEDNDANYTVEGAMSDIKSNSGVPDGVREYVPGDDLRRVHWKITARSKNLMIKEYAPEKARLVLICCDFKSRFDHNGETDNIAADSAVECTLALVMRCLNEGCAAAVSYFDRGKTVTTEVSPYNTLGLDLLYTRLTEAAIYSTPTDVFDVTYESLRAVSPSEIFVVSQTPCADAVVKLEPAGELPLRGIYYVYCDTGVDGDSRDGIRLMRDRGITVCHVINRRTVEALNEE